MTSQYLDKSFAITFLYPMMITMIDERRNKIEPVQFLPLGNESVNDKELLLQ